MIKKDNLIDSWKPQAILNMLNLPKNIGNLDLITGSLEGELLARRYLIESYLQSD